MSKIKDDDFFIILPSNVGGELHKNNKISSYTTHFPAPLLFADNYEVALSEIHYPHSFLNVFPDVEHPIVLKKLVGRRWKVLNLRLKGSFTPETLIDTIHQNMSESGINFRSRFLYSSNTHRFRIEVESNEIVRVFGNLSMQLGFNHNVGMKGSGVLVGSNVGDMNLLDHLFYVYISCIKEYIVGNQYMKLLRLISVQGQHGDNIYESYSLPYYHDLNCRNINSIDISIRDYTGELIKFEYGSVIIKLHFRKKKQ